MVDNISSVVSAILSGITTLITPPTGTSDAALAYAALLALPFTGGIVAFARRLVKKSR